MKPFWSTWIVLLCLGVATPGFALLEGTIIQITRPLAMTSLPPLPPKDFYIDIGQHDGVKVGDVLEVSRELTVVNGLSGLPDHVMKVVIGNLKIILAGDFNSIGRAEGGLNPQELPSLDPPTFMLGDLVHLKSSLPFR